MADFCGYYRELQELQEDARDADFGFLENVELSDGSCLYDYLHGYCDEFAAALSDYYGYALEYIIDSSHVLVHAYCVAEIAGEKAYIDVRGITTDSDLFFGEFEDFCTFENGRFYDSRGECKLHKCRDSREMYGDESRVLNANNAFVQHFKDFNSYYDTKVFEREKSSPEKLVVGPAVKTKKQLLNEVLGQKADFLEGFFYSQGMDDIVVDVKNGHLVAHDGDGNRWKDSEIYDFALNECLDFNPDGSLSDGLGAAEPFVERLKEEAKGFGVEITSFVRSVDDTIRDAVERAEIPAVGETDKEMDI